LFLQPLGPSQRNQAITTTGKRLVAELAAEINRLGAEQVIAFISKPYLKIDAFDHAVVAIFEPQTSETRRRNSQICLLTESK
jgi:hypothetical protein